MRKNWWKILCVGLLIYVILPSFLMNAPRLNILNETIRNLHFHVTMWFGMVILLTASMVQAIKYLRSGKIEHHDKSFDRFFILLFINGICWSADD